MSISYQKLEVRNLPAGRQEPFAFKAQDDITIIQKKQPF